MKRVWILAVITLSVIEVALSQTIQTPTPPPTTAPFTQDPANFNGKVTAYTTTDIRVNRYSFEPAGRTNWHSHERGQTIVVEEGTLRTQTEGGAVREYKPRETFYTAPGEKHWHGATSQQPMRQVSVSFGVTSWFQPVTDSQYRGSNGR